MTRDELRNAIGNACDIMRREGLTTMDYMEQLSWLLFLKSLEETENNLEAEAAYNGRTYDRILAGDYRWSAWAGPDKGLTGDALVEFINNDLFPHLRSLSGTPEREMIANIFAEIYRSRLQNGYVLRDVINIIEGIDFHSTEDVHVLSLIYEELLAQMGSEAGFQGEFYTPRHIIRFMVQMVDPKIGETVYDPACGTGGFLAEAYRRMRERESSIADYETLQRRTFFGREKSARTYLLGLMNLILHGIQVPNIERINTLARNVRNIPEAERYDVILTNPPFGGSEHETIQQNFPIKGQATEMLFLQHIMKSLKRKRGSRAGVVVPEGMLFRGGAFASVRRELLEEFNLHTVVSMPPGVFLPYSGVKTNVLFFDRPGPTQDVWYYEIRHDGFSLTQTRRPIPENDIPDMLEKWRAWEESDWSWIVPAEEIVANGYDLTARNPRQAETAERRSPEELVASVLTKEERLTELLGELQELLGGEHGKI